MSEAEYIDDRDDLYRRIPQVWYVREEGRIDSAAFMQTDLSVDWSKYSTPEKSVAKYPRHHCAALQALIPRKLDLEVIHTPSAYNIAHSSIRGKKTLQVATELAVSSRIVVERPV